jgi:hypothetical protein
VAFSPQATPIVVVSKKEGQTFLDFLKLIQVLLLAAPGRGIITQALQPAGAGKSTYKTAAEVDFGRTTSWKMPATVPFVRYMTNHALSPSIL